VQHSSKGQKPKTGNGKQRPPMIADATHSPEAGPIVRFALDRVHDAADLLYEHAKDSIDRAENAMSEIHVDQLLQRSVPLIRRCKS
jgi:hypothetical protein